MRALAVALVALIAASGCKKTEKSNGGVKRAAEAGDAAVALPPGELGPVRGTEAPLTLVVYYLPKPTTPPRAVFDELVKASPGVAIDYSEHSPPVPMAADTLDYTTRGLDAAQRAALPRSQMAVALGFANRPDHAAADLRRAQAIAGDLATRTGGLVSVVEAGMLFGPGAWQNRVASLASDPPAAPGLYTVHMYEVEGGGIRLVSLGLNTLALPELAIDGAPGTRAQEANALMNLIAQLLVEGQAPAADGRFTVDVKALRNAEVAAQFQSPEFKMPSVDVKLVPAPPQDGDNEGRLWRIDFLGNGSYSERLVATTTKLFSITDDVINAEDDDAELMAARDRARARLPEVKARFAKGLKPGSHLLVKGPLGPADSIEWVWVEVRRWDGGTIHGVLMSQPNQDLGLKEGSEVEVAEAEVFDWSLHKDDGSREGGETDEILLRRQR